MQNVPLETRREEEGGGGGGGGGEEEEYYDKQQLTSEANYKNHTTLRPIIYCTKEH